MYLVDTVTWSELRKRNPKPGVVAWLRSSDAAELFFSVMTLGELERGVVRQRVIDPAFATRLGDWLEETKALFADRTLPVTLPIALAWGRLSLRMLTAGTDLLIAATAIQHDLTVVTRNVRHFEGTGAKVLNPFDETVSL